MKIYLMRHGQSPSVAEAGVESDFDRPLSAEGRAEARKAAANLLAQGAKPAVILASPLLRAQQTAKEAASVLKPAPKVVTYEPLSNQIPGPEVYERLLDGSIKESELLMIGHQPQLGELAGHLLGDSFQIKTAGVIALETSGASRAK